LGVKSSIIRNLVADAFDNCKATHPLPAQEGWGVG
jgi:hypothetical protein